jgi:hypothetical protein
LVYHGVFAAAGSLFAGGIEGEDAAEGKGEGQEARF